MSIKIAHVGVLEFKQSVSWIAIAMFVISAFLEDGPVSL